MSTGTTDTRHFDVDLSGLIRVFGGHLYSSPEVFARELVQNAADAIAERRRGEAGFQGTITVRADPDAGAVEFVDDGVGLDERGLAEYLSRIGHSSKRGADGAHPDEALLGQFGIGLLSGFLVAESLVVETRKAGGEGLRWLARIDGSYRVERVSGEIPTGTRVRVPLSTQHRVYAQPDVLRDVLTRYVAYLPFAVELVTPEGREPISRPAPWLAERPAAWRDWLVARGIDARFVVPLRAGEARGFAWVHNRQVQFGGARCDVYLKGMLLKSDARDVLPEWAGFCAAVLEAPGLRPTASREEAVRDEAFAALQEGVRAALLGWLAELPDRDPLAFDEFLKLHHLFVKGACLESEALMHAIGDRLPFETNFGVSDLAAFLKGHEQAALHFVTSPQEFAHVAPLAAAQGLGLINASYVYDEPFLEAFARRFGLRTARLDAGSLQLLVSAAPAGEAERYAAVLRAGQALLEDLDVELAVGRFRPAELPAFLVTDAAELRERAGAAMRRASAPPVARALLGNLPVMRQRDARPRFVLNVDNALVRALPASAPDVAARVIRLLYTQSALVLRRTLSLAETRMFSADLLSLLGGALAPQRGARGGLN